MQRRKGAEAQRRRGAEARRRGGAEAQRRGGAEARRRRGAEAQRRRGAEAKQHARESLLPSQKLKAAYLQAFSFKLQPDTSAEDRQRKSRATIWHARPAIISADGRDFNGLGEYIKVEALLSL